MTALYTYFDTFLVTVLQRNFLAFVLGSRDFAGLILESGKWGSGKVPQMAFPKNSELGSIGEMKCVLCTQFFLRTVDVSTLPRVLYCGSSR